MSRNAIAFAVLLLIAWGCTNDSMPASTAAPAPTASEVLADVVAATGAGNLTSISYSGGAWRIRNGWMQTPSASPPWPSRDAITSYRRTIDLGAPASRATGETFAQDIFMNPPTAGTYNQNIRADQTGWAQQLEIWLTPWGFLEGAKDNGVELSTGKFDGVEYRVLTWRSPESQLSPGGQRYTVNGYINDDNLVAAVETWVDDMFAGDFHIAQAYGGYRAIDGVQVPTTIEQQRAGGAVFGVIVQGADANPANLAELMMFPQGGPGGPPGGPPGGQAPTELVEDLGDGAWLIKGGYVALVTEFTDHVIVFEGGQPYARGEQILAEVAKLVPNKPIRYVVNSHPHSDHTGGLVPFLKQGITLITHENNVEFLTKLLSAPRTLLGEPPLNPTIEGASGVTVYEDGANRLELHSVPNGHTDGMLVAVLPKQGVLFQADFTLPQPGAQANPFVRTLATYVDENNVAFERYLAVHAAQMPQNRAQLLAAIGK